MAVFPSAMHPLDALRWRPAAVPAGVLGAVLLGPAGAAAWAAALGLAALLGRRRGLPALLLLGALAAGAALLRADVQRLTLDGRAEVDVDVRIVSATPVTAPRRLLADVLEVHASALPPAQQRRLRRVRISLFEPLAVRSGEHWRLCLRVRAPKGFANPGGADFERRLFRQRVSALAYVRDNGCAVRLQMASAGVDAWRGRLAKHLADRLPGRGGRLLVAMLLGERGDFTAADWDLLGRTGTAHLVVVSGLHVGLVAGFVLLLLRAVLQGLLGSAARTPMLLALVAAAAYGTLTGLGLPVQRALVMFAAVLGLSLLRRVSTRPALLGWAATAVLLYDPLAVLDAGFWLSFLAVAALMLVWRRREDGLWRWRGVLQAQLAVALLLAPALTQLFGQLPWSGPLVNLVLVPLVGLVLMPAALSGLLLLAVPVLQPLGETLLQLAAWGLVTPLQALDGLAVRGPPLRLGDAWMVLPATLGAALALLRLPVAVRLLGAGLLVGSIQAPDTAPPAGQVRLDVLDVGQGLAVVVQTRDHALLYDAGPRFGATGDAGSLVVVPALRALGVAHLDMLLISHADMDHAGGARSVHARMPVGEVVGPVPGTLAIPGTRCRRGRHWTWNGVVFRMLHPEDRDGAPRLSDNAGSCVLLIDTGTVRVLLPGDADRAVERRIVADTGALDLLVAGHHGSDTSTGPTLLRHARPRLAVVSAGLPNRFGHPHADVVDRLRTAGVVWRGTGRAGAVSWSSAEPRRLRSWRDAHRSYWNWPAQ